VGPLRPSARARRALPPTIRPSSWSTAAVERPGWVSGEGGFWDERTRRRPDSGTALHWPDQRTDRPRGAGPHLGRRTHDVRAAEAAPGLGRQVIRKGGFVLTGLGVLLLAWVGVTAAWGDPFTSLYTRHEQQALARRLDEIDRHWRAEAPRVPVVAHVDRARQEA